MRGTFLLMEAGEINLGASLQYYNKPTQKLHAYGTKPYQLVSYCTVAVVYLLKSRLSPSLHVALGSSSISSLW